MNWILISNLIIHFCTYIHPPNQIESIASTRGKFENSVIRKLKAERKHLHNVDSTRDEIQFMNFYTPEIYIRTLSE